MPQLAAKVLGFCAALGPISSLAPRNSARTPPLSRAAGSESRHGRCHVLLPPAEHVAVRGEENLGAVAQVPGDLVYRLTRHEHQGGGRAPKTMQVESVRILQADLCPVESLAHVPTLQWPARSAVPDEAAGLCALVLESVDSLERQLSVLSLFFVFRGPRLPFGGVLAPDLTFASSQVDVIPNQTESLTDSAAGDAGRSHGACAGRAPGRSSLAAPRPVQRTNPERHYQTTPNHLRPQ